MFGVYCMVMILGQPISVSFGNDGAAEIGQGGIVFEKEPNISIESERLEIGVGKVRVKYLFKNGSKSSIKRLVAFPIPDIRIESEGPESDTIPSFMDFEAAVNGKRIEIKREVKILAGASKDIAPFLDRFHVGYSTREELQHGLLGLSPVKIGELRKISGSEIKPIGNIGEDGKPEFYDFAWTKRVNYYWEQEFPSGREITIEHSYTPHTGSAQSPVEKGVLEASCAEEGLIRTLQTWSGKQSDSGEKKNKPRFFFIINVRYILQTAKTWLGPIKDFSLMVEKPSEASLVSFCAKGVKKTDSRHFAVTYKNYVPEKDLEVYFFLPNEKL